MNPLKHITDQFLIEGSVETIEPLGNGLINRTYKVTNADTRKPDYVLQCINEGIFTDVPLLQHNIEAVTGHLRKKLQGMTEQEKDRHVLRILPTRDGKTFCRDEEGKPWRLSVFIPGSVTKEQVTAESAYITGRAFGNFETQLTDMSEPIGETIPDFHNMELRIRQLQEALIADKAGRKKEMAKITEGIMQVAEVMCSAERSWRDGRLPKRICHCDTKVNNVLYDALTDEVLCVIDLDTVMPAFVFSDYGDFLRTAANYVAEDAPDVNKVGFRMDIYEAFTRGYLETARFLQPIERDNLPFAAVLFPYMQCVRFLTDYLNGDTYYRISHPTHNLERTRNQWALYRAACNALFSNGQPVWRQP